MTASSNNLEPSLFNLPLFKADVQQVTKINKGHSHQAFKVDTLTGSYFAKFFKQPSKLIQEVEICQLLNKHDLSLPVIYADKHWLITKYIKEQVVTPTDKLPHMLSLLSKLHHISLPLNKTIKPLDFSLILADLIEYSCVKPSLRAVFSQTATTLLKPITDNDRLLVLCHGDANYENLLTISLEKS